MGLGHTEGGYVIVAEAVLGETEEYTGFAAVVIADYDDFE
jgi:hypothetical protein